MFNQKEYLKQYYKENKEKLKEKRKQYVKDNADPIKRCQKQWREKNREKIKKYMKQYRIDNRNKEKEQRKKWAKENSEKMRASRKQWQNNNPIYMNQYFKNRRKIDLRFNLNSKMRTAIGRSLKGNKAGQHWETLVGYTLKVLIKHLNGTMPSGYCWKDYMIGKLHIDHIIPISAFNYTKPEHVDFKRCWALSNLKLLPAKENIAKKDKLENIFQPALKI